MEYHEPLKPCPRCGAKAKTLVRNEDCKIQIRCSDLTCGLAVTVENESGVKIRIDDQMMMLRHVWNEKVQPDMIRVGTMH